MKLTFFDLEASAGEDGFPIELGFAELHLETGDIQSEGRLIQPSVWWERRLTAGSLKWDLQAEQIHGLSRDYVRVSGRPVAEVARWASAWIRGREIWSDNAQLDGQWLRMIIEEGLADEAWPTYRVSGLPRVKAYLPTFMIEEVQQQFSDAGRVAHRAEDDAVAHAMFVRKAWANLEIRRRLKGIIW